MQSDQIHVSVRSSQTLYILRRAPEPKKRKHDVHLRRSAAHEVIASQRLPRARLGHTHRESLHIVSLRFNYADIAKRPLVRHLLGCSAPGVTKISATLCCGRNAAEEAEGERFEGTFQW